MLEYDLVIAGAGPAGFGAALGAARLGKKVLIFDRNSAPGGVAAFCSCPVFSGLRSFAPEDSGGVAGEFAAAIKNNAIIRDNSRLNTSEFQVSLTMERLLKQANVHMIFYVELTGV